MDIPDITNIRMAKDFYNASDASEVTPKQTLRAVLDDIQNGHIDCDGLIICTYKKGFEPDWYACNLIPLEAVGVLECVKMDINKNRVE